MKTVIVLVGFSYTPTSIRKIVSRHEDALILSDNPYCCELLDSIGRQYITTEEFVSSQQLSETGILNYSYLDSVIETLDNEMIKQVSLNNNRIYTGGLIERYFFTFKRVLDCIHCAYLLGQQLQKKYGQICLFVYSTVKNNVRYKPYDFNFYEYLFVKSLTQTVQANRVKVNRLPVLFSLAEGILVFKKLIGESLSATRHLFRALKLKILMLSGQQCSVITNAGYDISYLYPCYKKKMKDCLLIFDPSRLSQAGLFLTAKMFGVYPGSKSNSKKIFGIANAVLSKMRQDLPQQVIDAFRDAVIAVMEGSYAKNLLCAKLGEILAKQNTVGDAISACVATSAESLFLLGVSRGGGRTYQYQHGGGQGYLDKKMSAWFHSQTDNLFCYGDVVKDHQKIKKGVNVYPVGSYRFQYLKKNIKKTDPSEKLNLICIPSYPLGHRAYYPDFRKSDLFCYALWKDLLRVTLGVNKELNYKYSILVKSSHYYGPKKDYFFKLKEKADYNALEVVSSGTMEPYLNKGDVFLTDNPETSLLEIMLTDKPIIFYYTGGYSVEKSCKDMLCKRVFWVENSKQLSAALLSVASNYDKCVRDKDDRSFLEYNFKEIVPPEKFIDLNFGNFNEFH